jgi:hypothetical protein
MAKSPVRRVDRRKKIQAQVPPPTNHLRGNGPALSVTNPKQSSLHAALAMTFKKDREADVLGNETIHGLGAAVMAQYCTTNPVAKLKALQNAQAIAIAALHNDGRVPEDIVYLLIDTARLLKDMEYRANNPLVRYASHPGRGSQHDSHWDKDARRYLAAAARALWRLTKERGQTAGATTLHHACDSVWSWVDNAIKTVGGEPLCKRFPGGWSQTTAERALQIKKPATGGERVEGWGEQFKRARDASYLKLLDQIDRCQSVADLEEHLNIMVSGGIARLLNGTIDASDGGRTEK